jgi:hypothetical protein
VKPLHQAHNSIFSIRIRSRGIRRRVSRKHYMGNPAAIYKRIEGDKGNARTDTGTDDFCITAGAQNNFATCNIDYIFFETTVCIR